MAEGSFGGHLPHPAPERCLNQRHKSAGCTRCAVSCPTAAIDLSGNRPSLDPELCVQCGACLVACPTDVFAQPNPPELTLARTVQNLPGRAPLALVCPQHPAPSPSPIPVAALVRHARCLASLSLPLLLDLCQMGQRSLWLDDSACQECPIAACHALITTTVTAANQLLAAFGEQPALALSSTHAPSLRAEPVALPLLDGMKPQTSRRGFFDALRQMGEERVERALAEEPPPMLRPAVAVNARLPRQLPASRRELLIRIDRLAASGGEPAVGEVDLDALPFAAVTVAGDRCSACGLCARFCPTGALRFDGPEAGWLRDQDPTEYALFFQPRLCIDCAICKVACPENAITFAENLPIQALAGESVECLAAGETAGCEMCGAALSLHVQPRRCYVCRPRAGTVASLRDEAGLMTDRLRCSGELSKKL